MPMWPTDSGRQSLDLLMSSATQVLQTFGTSRVPATRLATVDVGRAEDTAACCHHKGTVRVDMLFLDSSTETYQRTSMTPEREIFPAVAIARRKGVGKVQAGGGRNRMSLAEQDVCALNLKPCDGFHNPSTARGLLTWVLLVTPSKRVLLKPQPAE